MDVCCVCFTCISMQTRGVWGHASPGNFWKLEALRLPFWDRSRDLILVSVSSYMARRVLHLVFGCWLDIRFSREKVLRLAEQQAVTY